MNRERFRELAKEIAEGFKDIPVVWDGKAAILEMKDAGYPHWRQMEWIGWYFQFMCENLLAEQMEIPGPAYGNVRFDGLRDVPWDFKSHANTSGHTVIVNDSEAISRGIEEYGSIGVILAAGDVEYDEDRTFQQWHEDLKGGKSAYVRERIRRGAPSRRRKVRFTLERISFIRMTDELLVRCGSFQKNFRNADGSPRRKKVSLDLEDLGDALMHVIDFGKQTRLPGNR